MNPKSDHNLPFFKMHGAGNDFVILDARQRDIDVTPALAQALGDRHRGVGFDQLAVIKTGAQHTELVFYNADGSLSAACGNATRCIAQHLMTENGTDKLILKTERGDLSAVKTPKGQVSVNMGLPLLNWQDIPLASDVDTLNLPIDGSPTATGMGNPHCSFFVEDADALVLTDYAPFEHHPLFPQRTNVQLVSVMGKDLLRVRVWERGVGPTLASGSSSCAVVVAAHRRGLTGRKVAVQMDGGLIQIDWREDGVWMAGPTAHVFDGVLTSDFLDDLT